MRLTGVEPARAYRSQGPENLSARKSLFFILSQKSGVFAQPLHNSTLAASPSGASIRDYGRRPARNVHSVHSPCSPPSGLHVASTNRRPGPLGGCLFLPPVEVGESLDLADLEPPLPAHDDTVQLGWIVRGARQVVEVATVCAGTEAVLPALTVNVRSFASRLWTGLAISSALGRVGVARPPAAVRVGSRTSVRARRRWPYTAGHWNARLRTVINAHSPNTTPNGAANRLT